MLLMKAKEKERHQQRPSIRTTPSKRNIYSYFLFLDEHNDFLYGNNFLLQNFM
jgi:L-rhamnose mutarotase